MSERDKLTGNLEESNHDLKGSCNDDREGSVLTMTLKKEINGPKGLEPTRYGDWESKGRCYDF